MQKGFWPKLEEVFEYAALVYRGNEGTLRAVECRFFIVEKSADMGYNKLLNYAGVTGDYSDSRFRERNAYEK